MEGINYNKDISKKVIWKNYYYRIAHIYIHMHIKLQTKGQAFKYENS